MNLSTNLADLDKAINQLRPPLVKIKGDVELISGEIDSGLERIKALLDHKRQILAKKLLLKNMMGLQEKLEYLEQHEDIELGKNIPKILPSVIFILSVINLIKWPIKSRDS